jgi:hypothetical protein
MKLDLGWENKTAGHSRGFWIASLKPWSCLLTVMWKLCPYLESCNVIPFFTLVKYSEWFKRWLNACKNLCVYLNAMWRNHNVLKSRQIQLADCTALTLLHCPILFNSNKSPTRCNSFSNLLSWHLFTAWHFFGCPHAHHQELNNCSSSLWFYLRTVVIAVLLIVAGPAGLTTTNSTATTTLRR